MTPTLTDRLSQFMLQLGAEWVFYLLLLLSGISIALILERLAVLFLTQSPLEKLQTLLLRLLEGQPLKEVQQALQQEKGVEARVLAEGLARCGAHAERLEDVVAGLMGLEKLKLERGIALLGTIGNNAPFIGLLGTVLGIVKAFHDLGKNVGGGADVVMAGISEALVATAIGLLVAIPAVMAYNFCQRQIKRRMATLTALTQLAMAGLKAHPQSAATSQT